MKTLFLITIAVVFSFSLPAISNWAPTDTVPPVAAQSPSKKPRKTMRAFTSDQELVSYFKQLGERQRRRPQTFAAATRRGIGFNNTRSLCLTCWREG